MPNYFVLPQTERTKTGGEAFLEGASPYIQQAFAMMLQRKMQEQQRQRNLDLARQTNPELFMANSAPMAQKSYQETKAQSDKV